MIDESITIHRGDAYGFAADVIIVFIRENIADIVLKIAENDADTLVGIRVKIAKNVFEDS